MGGIYGCGCKEVYRFPHTTYPYFSCIYLPWLIGAMPLHVRTIYISIVHTLALALAGTSPAHVRYTI